MSKNRERIVVIVYSLALVHWQLNVAGVKLNGKYVSNIQNRTSDTEFTINEHSENCKL